MTTDGVGTKLIIADAMKKWDTVGIDCIAMNVNDLYVMGVEPLAFVDYISIEKPNENLIAQVIESLNEGARQANISIIGGETASLPDIIKGFDLAGTAVGTVDKDKVITGEKIAVGDVVIGLPSNGIHSNGYSLVRKVIAESGLKYTDPLPYNKKTTIGDELLKPTRIYAEVVKLFKKYEIKGMAHITGGGLFNLKRITKYGFDFNDPLPCRRLQLHTGPRERRGCGNVPDLQHGHGIPDRRFQERCGAHRQDDRRKDRRHRRRQRLQHPRHQAVVTIFFTY